MPFVKNSTELCKEFQNACKEFEFKEITKYSIKNFEWIFKGFFRKYWNVSDENFERMVCNSLK